MACIVRSLPGAVGTLLSSTSVRAHVCLALTSPGRPLANDVAPLEPVAGTLLSLRVCLDTATCVPAPASWPTSTWHVALCDLQPFSSRAGPCTSACVLLVCCIPNAWGVLCYSLWSIIASWQGSCMVLTFALLLCTVVGDLLLHYHLALTRVLRLAHCPKPVCAASASLWHPFLTEWPTLHSSLLGSTAKVFLPILPRACAGLPRAWPETRRHVCLQTSLPRLVPACAAPLGSVLLDCVTLVHFPT